MTTAVINEPNGYKPVDPASYGRFPTSERERLNELGAKAMTAQTAKDNDQLIGAVNTICLKAGFKRTKACDLIGYIAQTKFLQWMNGFAELDDAERMYVRRWLTKHGWNGVDESPKVDGRIVQAKALHSMALEKKHQRIIEQAPLVKQAHEKLNAGASLTSLTKASKTDGGSVMKWLDGKHGFTDTVLDRVKDWLDDKTQTAKGKLNPEPALFDMRSSERAGPIEVPVRRLDSADRLAVLLNISRDEALNRILETVDPKAIAIEWHRKQIEALEAI